MAAGSDPRWPPQAGGPAAPLFTVRITGENGRTVVWAAGELDPTVGAALGDALSAVPAVPGQLLTVDLTHLGFLDVTGLRLLTTADERLRAAGGAGLAVRGATGIVRRAFEIMRVTRLLD